MADLWRENGTIEGNCKEKRIGGVYRARADFGRLGRGICPNRLHQITYPQTSTWGTELISYTDTPGDVSAGKHPNLAAAQRFSQQAYTKIIAAQQANEWDMQGHAQKAKSLLDQVNSELKLAAEAANKK